MKHDKPSMPVTTCDSLRERLNYLKGIAKYTFREIAAMDEFLPVPAGTLCAIAKGKDVPDKWRERFNLQRLEPAPVCPRCGVVHVTKRCTANDKPITRRWVRVLGHAGYAEVER